jgi:transposase InsO family protein
LTERRITHRTIPPRMPKRNGKIERYQQTLAREWAYGQRYRTSHARAAALTHWLAHYNHSRPHSSLGGQSPISRATNLAGHDS